jgi:ring-1,2-phenylacetyl-CoA epoxidase subunit PaaC
MTSDHDDHDSVYDGLFGGDSDHWAFGTDFADPLAGMEATIPVGVDPRALAQYCLMLGDDALVLSHRLSQWCGNAPELELDIALANIALDLLGQARLLLVRAASADPSVVPPLPLHSLETLRSPETQSSLETSHSSETSHSPETQCPSETQSSLETRRSPVPAEDALAFFRDDWAYRNAWLAEAPNGDFGQTVARILLFTTVRLAIFERLCGSRDAVLAAVAAKGVRELTYHRDFAGRWFLTLARGTGESRRRVIAGLAEVWRHHDELFRAHPVERELSRCGVAVDPATVAGDADAALATVFAASGVERPVVSQAGQLGGRSGRDGVHTEALSLLLAEMQSVARAHPLGRW